MRGENQFDNVIRVDFGGNAKSKKELPAPPDALSAQKLRLFSEWIEAGMVMVVSDPRTNGVQVPSYLRNLCELRLNFSLRFDLRDFAFDEQGISATLMFPEGLFFCMLPWPAVFALHSYETNAGVMFPESIPDEFTVDVKSGSIRWKEQPKAESEEIAAIVPLRPE